MNLIYFTFFDTAVTVVLLISGILYLLIYIGGVMVSVLASIAVDLAFEPWSGQAKDYQIVICCFSAKHNALRSKSNDWFVSESE